LKIEHDISKIQCDALFEAESERFNALEKVGFRVNRQAVLVDWVILRGGGYYIDVGTSKRIADGEIKVKSGVPIRRFTETGLEFDDGEVLRADVVVLATGYQKDARRQAAGILGDEIARNMPKFGGLDEEGEIRGSLEPSGE
jgi:cation diffusion facilitator CzcD-associated flavoprotein CzcO